MSEESAEKQVSRAPAMKVAGSRITKHHKEPDDKPLTHSELVKQQSEYNSEITTISVNDLLTREERDSHDKTVKKMNTKPQPTYEKPHADPSRRIIQQPLK